MTEKEIAQLRNKLFEMKIENRRMRARLEGKAEECAVCVLRHQCERRCDRERR